MPKRQWKAEQEMRTVLAGVMPEADIGVNRRKKSGSHGKGSTK